MKPNKTHQCEMLERGGTKSATPRVRVIADHSPDCSDARDRDVLWLDEGHIWRDVRGTARGSHRRWILFRCNGVSSKEHGDEQGYCTARIIVEPYRLSDVINIVLHGGV